MQAVIDNEGFLIVYGDTVEEERAMNRFMEKENYRSRIILVPGDVPNPPSYIPVDRFPKPIVGEIHARNQLTTDSIGKTPYLNHIVCGDSAEKHTS